MDINTEVYQKIPALNFMRFGINPQSGFLRIKDKRVDLASYPLSPSPYMPVNMKDIFDEWDNFAHNLPEFYESNRITNKLHMMPPLQIGVFFRKDQSEDFAMRPYRNRAFQILTFIASAIIHPYKSSIDDSRHYLPDKISEPLLSLASCLHRKPIMSYQEYTLDNCLAANTGSSLGDFNKLGVGNFILCQKFVNSKNELGFIAPHQGMEYRASPILVTAGAGQLNVLREDNISLKHIMWKWSSALRDMLSQQILMWQTCDWTEYATEVRPQIQYFENVQYGDKGPTFKMLRGETGAQSALFKVIDTLLGVKHKRTELTNHLDEMEQYMPSSHREFISAVHLGPSVREYILKCKDSDHELVDVFNDCIVGVIKLREAHFGFMKYIPKTHSGNHQLGTGGTPIYAFLPQLIEETKDCLTK